MQVASTTAAAPAAAAAVAPAAGGDNPVAAPPAASSSSGAGVGASNGGAGGSSRTPLEDAMRAKLTASLQPQALTIINQSDQHAGHAAMRAMPGKAAATGETHFRIEVVSAAFEGQMQVKRHRAVNALLAEEFAAGLHALSLDTKTPAEAEAARAKQ